ncbi:MAG TPA: gephyrin-like molybdotransferase Glp [Geminicoccaceae bacterium]|nr:gephyrin-like molybdotransferase Glp [Geminicoccaceae bacterium]
MLAVEEAHARIAGAFAPLPSEWVHLAAAADRVLARDLVAERDQPPGDTSAMDGYAVRAADLASGSATLRLVGSAPAGGSYDRELGPGETVRIFTGGLLPRGADAVALQENASANGDQVRIEGAIEPGIFVRPAGLDFRRGERALPSGRRLSPRDVGLAAALNRAWLPVRRRPRIALLATGDELVLPGQPLGPSQIVNSNTVALAAMVRHWGGEPVDLGIVRDRPDSLAEASEQLRAVDLAVTLGGASVGERDLVRAVLGEHGLTLDFWQIAMRPGKPLMFGRVRDVPLLGLPGNPVSAGVCAVLFVRAAICALLGLDPAPPEVPGVLGTPLGANDHRQEYLRASVAWRDDGRLEATPAPRQDSSMLATFARADCLIKRAPFAPAKAPGTPVFLLLLGSAPLAV